MKFNAKQTSFFLLAPCLLWGAASSAATMSLMGNPTGVSSFIPGTAAVGGTGGTSPTIFAGMVSNSSGTMLGGCAAGKTTTTSTCNSCDGSGLKPCNPVSIHPALELSFIIRSDTATLFQGTPLLRYKIGSSGNIAPPTIPTLQVGTDMNVKIPWSQLCGAAGIAGCIGKIEGQTLTVGITNDGDDDFEESVPMIIHFRQVDIDDTTIANYQQCNEGAAPASPTQGICDFEVIPGDEKIYLQYFAPSSNALETPHSTIKYDRLVFFHAPTFAEIKNNSEQFVLQMTNNAPNEPTLASRKITGLQNEQTYCMALGNQDQASNITFFTPPSELDQSAPAKVAKYCAVPSEVVGLLDDKSCFIATATFGSDMAPEVQTFREFRNQFLLTNNPGRAFVRAYYKYGPIAAEWISESPFLKSASLTLLWPLLQFVKLSLGLGLLPALLIVVLLAAAMQRMVLQLRRRRSSLGEA